MVLIEPKELNNLRLYRLTNEDECHRGLQYKVGLIEDSEPFNPSGECSKGGMYFFDETQLSDYKQYCFWNIYWIRTVTLLPESQVWKEDGKYKTDKFVLGPRKRFLESDLAKYVNFEFMSSMKKDQLLIDFSWRGYQEAPTTPLKAHKEVVVALLKAGADVHAKEDQALRHASFNGYKEIVEILLQAGANVHAKGGEALADASKYGYQKIVEMLLQAGAHVHAEEDQALRHASSRGHKGVVKLLLQAGADVHAKEDQALRLASQNGHKEVVEMLLPVATSIHAKEDQALRVAAQNRHKEVGNVVTKRGLMSMLRNCAMLPNTNIKKCCCTKK